MIIGLQSQDLCAFVTHTSLYVLDCKISSKNSLPHLRTESRQHLREDQEVSLSWGFLTHSPLVQHHGLTRSRGSEVSHRGLTC